MVILLQELVDAMNLVKYLIETLSKKWN